ncbi:hypothetical protein FYL05_04270 [Lactobacillus salivarius]|uniref:Conjugal transfer protein n=1 Tax=Ligilactobacillus salivarius TaxID=1624 RepID=A0ABD6JA61_9LACO|nr:DUF5592 family protein [Ligilactobacillus salivarius]EFK78709.1 hypothetical protein HMPREF9269_0313 [Ligilactobacillus salivarius ACS-116-V-Col5a]MDE1498850.1 DUF5592 family protein [Ligilactobacillus salivarius]MDE1523662.1 DUF5592 family protein [Ligilactobacillus salivarius]MYU60101.1 hypothetical protein [Ligilactobacillus salivarius]MYY45280.1 hypothetical protein [Ligilactobacillus salivarius]
MKEFVIVPDIKAEIKFFWNIFLKDVAVLGLVIFATMLLSQLFPEEQSKQQYIFMGLGFILAIYLDLRPRTNPGKRNYEVIWMLLLNRQPKLFKSYGYYEFDKRK